MRLSKQGYDRKAARTCCGYMTTTANSALHGAAITLKPRDQFRAVEGAAAIGQQQQAEHPQSRA